MNECKRIHRQAMNYSLMADEIARTDKTLAMPLYIDAYNLERTAAEMLKDDFTAEPSRSVLYRSAATLALDCEKYQKALELVAAGIHDKAPAEIVSELEEVRVKAQEKLGQNKPL